MRRVIDLCLDMPMGAEALTNMLGAMCLDPLYRGYKKTYGAGVAAQVGLTVEEIDAIYESEGRDGFLRIIREAAEKHAVKPAEFVRHLDEVGVEWGITCDGDHDNRKTAEIVQAFPKKFKGFIFVDPNRGEEAVRELEMCVKEYGLHVKHFRSLNDIVSERPFKENPMLTEEQFSYLAKKYMDMVFRLALHYTKSRSESDDITQEVLLKLYRTDKPFESEDHVRYWLIRVTVNECKRAFLSPWKRTEPIEDYAEQLAFKTPEHSELFHAVMALPQKYRVPLFLYYYEGYSCEEISQFLGIPNATVRTRLRRGREQLKTDLQEANNDV